MASTLLGPSLAEINEMSPCPWTGLGPGWETNEQAMYAASALSIPERKHYGTEEEATILLDFHYSHPLNQTAERS